MAEPQTIASTKQHTPKYRRQKRRSGPDRAFVVLNNKRIYLGVYNTPESKAQYHRRLAEWQAAGRQLASDPQRITVVELIDRYWQHAQEYYRHADGTRTSEVHLIRAAMRPLKKLYALTPAADFGPLRLQAVRQEMLTLEWTRRNINHQIERIRRMFKWATKNELVPPSVYHGLLAVDGLRAGRSTAREPEPIKPVAEDRVTAVLPHVAPPVAAMIKLQLLTGMRPAEVCNIRGCELDRTATPWLYRPSQHKTLHHGHDRTIHLGPQAQKIVEPFLKPDPQAYLFSAAEGAAARRAVRTANRETPLEQGNIPGSNIKKHPKRQPGDHYDVDAYRRAIVRGCEIAFGMPEEYHQTADDRPNADDTPEQQAQKLERRKQKAKLRKAWHEKHVWHPHQLRHTAATRLRHDHGLEAAQAILGHRTLAATQIYAERNTELARQVMQQVG